MQKAFYGHEGNAGPNEREAYAVCERECFAEKRYGQNERDGGADVLQEADDDHGHSVCRRRIQQQGDGCQHSREDHQKHLKRLVGYGHGVGRCGHERPKRGHERSRSENDAAHDAGEHRFYRHAGKSRVAGLFLDGSVGGKRQGQCEGNPDGAAVDGDEERDSACCKAKRDLLHAREALVKYDKPEKDVEQRAEVIAYARFQQMSAVGGPNVDAPIGGGQNARCDERAQGARVAHEV